MTTTLAAPGTPSADPMALANKQGCLACHGVEKKLVGPGFREVAIATILATIWTLGWNTFVSAKDGLSFAISMYLAMTAALLAVREREIIASLLRVPAFLQRRRPGSAA